MPDTPWFDRPLYQDTMSGYTMPSSQEMGYGVGFDVEAALKSLVKSHFRGRIEGIVNVFETESGTREEALNIIRDQIAKVGVAEQARELATAFCTPSARPEESRDLSRLKLSPQEQELYNAINYMYGKADFMPRPLPTQEPETLPPWYRRLPLRKNTDGDDGLMQFYNLIYDEFFRLVSDFMAGKEVV